MNELADKINTKKCPMVRRQITEKSVIFSRIFISIYTSKNITTRSFKCINNSCPSSMTINTY